MSSNQTLTSADEGNKMSQGFLGWQCRIRQFSVRQGDGRPTPGMCPQITLSDGQSLGQIISLIIRKDSEEITAQFMHMVKKTQDPLERWEGAIRHLSSTYYQKPAEFSDNILALFGPVSEVCDQLNAAGRCDLNFEQNNQKFCLPCTIQELEIEHSDYQAIYWHNSLFNPNIPANARVICFLPDWDNCIADPPLP